MHQEVGLELWRTRKQAVETIYPYVSTIIKQPHLDKIKDGHFKLIQALDDFINFLEFVAGLHHDSYKAHSFYHPDPNSKQNYHFLAGFTRSNSDIFQKKIGDRECNLSHGLTSVFDIYDIQCIRLFYEFGALMSVVSAYYAIIKSPTFDQILSTKFLKLRDKYINIICLQLCPCFQELEESFTSQQPS